MNSKIFLIVIILIQIALFSDFIGGIASPWYYIQDYDYISGDYYISKTEFTVLGIKQTTTYNGYTVKGEEKYTKVKFQDRPQYVQHFISIGVFQFFGLFITVVGIIANVYTGINPSSFAPMITVVTSILALVFEIISLALLATITYAFQKGGCNYNYCSTLIGKAGTYGKWGIQGGFIASIIGVFFSLLLVIFTAIRFKSKSTLEPCLSSPSFLSGSGSSPTPKPQQMSSVPQHQAYAPPQQAYAPPPQAYAPPPQAPIVIIPSNLDINNKDWYQIVISSTPAIGPNGTSTQFTQYILKKYDAENPNSQPTLPVGQYQPPKGVVVPTTLVIDTKQWYQFVSQEVPVLGANGAPSHYIQQNVLQVYKKETSKK